MYHLTAPTAAPLTPQYGKVFRGRWRGLEVAVKRLVLPTNLSGAVRNERMAIMEAAISSSVSHPNIVKVGRLRRETPGQAVSGL